MDYKYQLLEAIAKKTHKFSTIKILFYLFVIVNINLYVHTLHNIIIRIKVLVAANSKILKRYIPSYFIKINI